MRQFVHVILLLFLAVTCCGKGSREMKQAEQNQSAVPDSVFKLSFSSGGGFTGLYQGYTISSDGLVQAWQRFPAGEDSILWQKRVSPAEIEALKRQFLATGALEQQLQASGNMQTLVRYERPDTTLTWSWADGPGEAPASLRKWHQQALQYVQGLDNNK